MASKAKEVVVVFEADSTDPDPDVQLAGSRVFGKGDARTLS